MVKRSLWKDPARNRKRSGKRKFIDTEDSIVYINSKSGSRRLKRLRRKQPSFVKQRQRKRDICKLFPFRNSLTLYDGKRRRRSTKKHSISTGNILVHPSHHAENTKFKGLHKLGQTCYFNSLIQSLLHTPLFRDAIKSLPQRALSVDVLRELSCLFQRMSENTSHLPNALQQQYAYLIARKQA